MPVRCYSAPPSDDYYSDFSEDVAANPERVQAYAVTTITTTSVTVQHRSRQEYVSYLDRIMRRTEVEPFARNDTQSPPMNRIEPREAETEPGPAPISYEVNAANVFNQAVRADHIVSWLADAVRGPYVPEMKSYIKRMGSNIRRMEKAYGVEVEGKAKSKKGGLLNPKQPPLQLV